MRRNCRVLIVLTVITSLFVPLVAAAALAPGDAAGSVTVNGKAIRMKYAYAKAEESEGERTTTVVLTDRAVPHALLTDPNRRQKAIDAGQLQALTLEIAADRSVKQAVFQSKALEHKSIPMSGLQTAFKASTFTNVAIAAKAKSTEKQTFFDDAATFDVSFSTAIGQNKFADSPSAAKELAAKAPKIGPGGATGTFSFDGQTTKLTHAFATTKPNAFDESKKDVVVYLTDRPIDREMILRQRKLMSAIEEGMRGLIVSINSEGTPVHLEMLQKGPSIQVSGSGIFNFDPVQFDDKQVEGRFFTPAPEDFMEHKYAYDVSFRSAVETVIDPRDVPVDASTGKKLPAGGGEPGKAYLALDKAIRTGNLQQVAKLAAKGVESPLDSPPEEQKQMLEMLKVMSPAKVKILDGYANAERATLHVIGDDPMEKGKKAKGTVQLVFEDGAWKIYSQKWRG